MASLADGDRTPSQKIGAGADLGTLEAGKLADLAFIAGDLLTNIDQLSRVHAVMENGRYYTRAELLAPFAADGSQAPQDDLPT